VVAATLNSDKASALLEEADQAYFHFRPRPDDPARYDQQTGFVESRTSGVAFSIGGNGAGTTEIAMHKLARFLMSTPPPRKDTPFWIIGDDYEQAMSVCWAEKLWGHGHIPRAEIDASRIVWYSEKLNYPFKVPLLPWPGQPSRNWLLEFKSYEQGRTKMQAKSLGGFCFSEQFPWELLVEVLRGCREYNYPGSKFAEFTPVDPGLTYQLENMQREDKLPPGWEIYRANTEVALEYGHVRPSWYAEFFGAMAPEEVETRKIGAWASFAGQIYRSFNPLVHCVDQMVLPRGMRHFRAIDWGAGPENAMVCLWGAKNGLGEWYIYDEYWSTDQELDVLEHLARIEAKHDWPEWDEFYGATFADPSSQDCMRLAMHHGFPSIMNGRNAVYEGINCIRRALKVQPATKRPRLLILRRRCPNLVREMGTYRWRQGTDSSVNPMDPRPEPLKHDDHAVDALRYMLFSEEGYGAGTYASQSRGAPRKYGVQFRNGNGHPIQGVGP
jgi:hypothetical protein